ncbi:Isochorismatase domain-containing protein 1 [Globomyces sp. JEL0801]|nr:Isochorismatase domain-containing protein 1 [Globomyces sp. JEL0801]
MSFLRTLPKGPVPKSTCFFLCDIQEAFRNLIYSNPQVIATADKMIKASNLLNIPLVVTEHYPKGLKHTVSELNIQSAKVFEKTKFSMWTTEVENHVKEELKSKSVVLFGIETHVCVLQTTLDLLEANMEVYVVLDGVSSQNPEERSVAIKRMRDAGAVVTTSETILFQLMGDARHPNFKAVSNLVKETKDSTKLGLTALCSNL